MSNIYTVSINVDAQYGHITYDEQSQTVHVDFPDAKVRETVINYLNQPHMINEPKHPSTNRFEAREYLAKNSKHDLQIVLSRMYNHIQVHVNWSIPAEIDMNNI